jgi:CubicO group peptidase (beta-lactamase class C family)
LFHEVWLDALPDFATPLDSLRGLGLFDTRGWLSSRESPKMSRLNAKAVAELLSRAQREVDEGLLPSCQVALAVDGELAVFETFGEATNDTRYIVYSATKAFVAGAMWALIGDGLVDPAHLVTHYIPEFGTNGKDVITLEQVMLHTSGFPTGPLHPLDGDTSAGRTAAFAKWRLNWEPGTRFEYHPSAAHWVLAEIIERVTGADYGDVVEQRVTTPAGLERVLRHVPHSAAHLSVVGQPPTAEDMMAAFGIAEYPVGEVTHEALLGFNDPAVQQIGMPGGGGVMRACDLAMYYQAILHNPGEMWRPDVLADVTTNVRNHLPDPVLGHPANRTLGLIQAGGDGKSNLRGMGRTVSPGTIGHNGAAGQLAWGDPKSGISFGYCTNGIDAHMIREHRRTTALASLAGVCANP